ncbi:hypothetical protein KPSA3_03463 [Pseudomonas syringae pv. actinidiae]|uniref:Uncharacterized protein n=1 Tax=Pseudomonas syringae pv. actinidiae TaxID=103796 RepID=A0AAN4Q889_PSESF|nr:hypothetical protein KPSA3_03463 [Pseudomonas syringae pv. actinidiae]
MINQAAHLLAGWAVYTFDRSIARGGIIARRDKCITAAAVRRTQRTVCLLQCLHLAFQRCIGAFHVRQQSQCALDLALLLFKLPPELVPVSRCLAAQQHVFPLLNLDLELQVSLINQLRSPHRTFKEAAIGLHIAGKKVETGERNDQHQHQAAAEQAQDLKPQGFGHSDDLWRKTGLRQGAEYDEPHPLRPNWKAQDVWLHEIIIGFRQFFFKRQRQSVYMSEKRQKNAKRRVKALVHLPEHLAWPSQRRIKRVDLRTNRCRLALEQFYHGHQAVRP